MKELPQQPNFPDMENSILDFWQQNQIQTKYLQKNQNSDKKYRFLDGPITANNPMGVHHAHGRTIKDFFQRYKNLKGFIQRFQNGFDCQGLWVEVEEEKDLGFNSKADIENYGLDKFSRSCRARVDKFSQVQISQSQRLGMFMDWENSYFTMSENNNLHIWHFLKKVNENGWLFKGIDAMPWCTRCGTAISQHELSDGGYKDVNHESIYLRFKIVSAINAILVKEFGLENDQIYFLVWTTTPWTLLSNDGVAINPQITYVIVKQNKEYLILAKNRINILSDNGEFQIVSEFEGQKLLDLITKKDTNEENNIKYEHPFTSLIEKKNPDCWLIPWSEVSDQEGTGLVHIAPSAGKEDFELSKELTMSSQAQQSSIDEFGIYHEGYGSFTGKSVFDVRQEIYGVLKDKGLFYKIEQIQHSYPHCWRCKHELVFRTTSEWFIKVDEIRPLMKKAASEVNWIPEHAGKRMQDWLDNMGNWPISRKRYWGLALPFYVSEDGNQYYVVGSKEELRNLALEPEKVDQLPELHRPWIDEIVLDGKKIIINGQTQSGVWRRVKDVGDCWLDAGIVPFSTVNYLNDKKYWEEWYPFEFITEYVAQVKLWFYATLFMSVTLEGKAPWQNVLATGFLVDEKGEAMHKSKGNAIAFDEAAQKSGADAIRWLYLRERSANYYGTGNLRFGYNILDEIRKRFLQILWNIYRFYNQNYLLDQPEIKVTLSQSNNMLDQWILSRFTSVLMDMNQFLDNFDSPSSVELLETFVVNDLSQWFIRRSKDRVGPTAKSGSQDKADFYQTSSYILNNLLIILSPFVPFVTESIYQQLRNDNDIESIHLTHWPTINSDYINKEIESKMSLIRRMTEKVLSARKENNIKVRQPLTKVTVILKQNPNLSDSITEIFLDEVNVKTIEYQINEDEIDLKVILDTNITDELKSEGILRELIRQIQTMRRNATYKYDQRINCVITSDYPQLNPLLNKFNRELKQKLLIENFTEIPFENPDIQDTMQIDDLSFTFSLKAL